MYKPPSPAALTRKKKHGKINENSGLVLHELHDFAANFPVSYEDNFGKVKISFSQVRAMNTEQQD